MTAVKYCRPTRFASGLKTDSVPSVFTSSTPGSLLRDKFCLKRLHVSTFHDCQVTTVNLQWRLLGHAKKKLPATFYPLDFYVYFPQDCLSSRSSTLMKHFRARGNSVVVFKMGFGLKATFWGCWFHLRINHVSVSDKEDSGLYFKTRWETTTAGVSINWMCIVWFVTIITVTGCKTSFFKGSP